MMPAANGRAAMPPARKADAGNTAMKRETRTAVGWIVAGILTLPFGIGIPLLVVGLALHILGERLRAERWIAVLFWMTLVLLGAGVGLLCAFPVEGADSAEAGMARSVLGAAPLVLAALLSLAMTALTLARFQSLSTGFRVRGLACGALLVGTAVVVLAGMFPWPAAGLGGLSVAIWAGLRWRRRRIRRKSMSSTPDDGTARPASARVAPEPVVKSPALPRTRKPVCGILAWVLLLLAVPAGLLVIHGLGAVVDTSDFKGMGAGLAIVGLGIGTAMLFGCISAVLALVSLRRRERYPALAAVLLVLYGLPLLVWGILLAVDAPGAAVTLLVLLLGGGGLAAGWVRQRRKTRAAAGPS